jgi:hypothetical protein
MANQTARIVWAMRSRNDLGAFAEYALKCSRVADKARDTRLGMVRLDMQANQVRLMPVGQSDSNVQHRRSVLGSLEGNQDALKSYLQNATCAGLVQTGR